MKQFRKTHSKYCRFVALVMAFIVAFSCIPFPTLATDNEPKIGTAMNAANQMTVSNNGVDVTADYQTNKVINVDTGTAGFGNGTFGNLIFGDSNSYNYVATVKMTEDKTGSYGSLRLTFGQGTCNGMEGTLEVVIRPNLDDVVLFHHVHQTGGAENVIAHIGGKATELNQDIACSIQYNNGKVSFWMNGEAIISDLDLAGAGITNIKLEPGFCAQESAGTISNIQIWGDVYNNVANQMTVSNNGVDVTEDYQTNKVINVDTGTASFGNGTFGNLIFGDSNSYNYAATVKMTEDKTGSYGSLRLTFGQGTCNGMEGTLEVVIRPNLDDVVLFHHVHQTGGAENVIAHIGGKATELNQDIACSIQYNNGKVSFWMNGEAIISDLDLAGAGITNIKLEPGFCAQESAGTISNIQIWGDVMAKLQVDEDDEGDEEEPNPEPTTGVPTLGDAENMADIMSVTNNGTDVTAEYQTNKVINVDTGTEVFGNGTFGKLVFGDSNSYNYAATLKMTEDKTGSYGSLRLTFGQGTYNGTEGVLEVAIRPNLDDIVLFHHVHQSGGVENVITHIRDKATDLNQDIACVIQYNNGKVSFWMNGEQIIADLDLAGAGITNIKLEPGFCAQKSVGTISDIQIWGDVMAKSQGDEDDEEEEPNPEPTTGAPTLGDAENMADIMTVTNNGTDVTAEYQTNKVINVDTGTEVFGNGTFGKLTFGDSNSYNYAATLKITEDMTESYGSLRLTFGQGTYNGTEGVLEVAIRPNLDDVVLFHHVHQAGGVENVITHVRDKATDLNQDIACVIQYNNGKVSFWMNGEQIIADLDLAGAGITNIKLQPGFCAQKSVGTISNIQIWGDVTEKSQDDEEPEPNPEPTTGAPTLGDAENMADIMTVTNNGTDVTAEYQTNKVINVDTGTAGFGKGTFGKLVFGDSNSYNYAATLKITEDKTGSYGSLRLTFGQGTYNGMEGALEVAIRPNLDDVVLFHHVHQAGGAESVIAHIGGKVTDLNQNIACVIQYNNGKVSFWMNGEAIISDLDLTGAGITNIKLEPGFCAQESAGTISNIQIWGDITEGVVIPEASVPKFNSKTEVNLIPQVVVMDVFSSKLYKLTSCSITSKKNATGRVDFRGITLNDDYTFYTKASFANNKNINPDSNAEFDWEGLIFRVANAEKDNTEYRIEVRVRNQFIVVFAVDGGGKEEVLALFGEATAFGEMNDYVLDYRKDGSFDFWKNGIAVIKDFKLTEIGFDNVTPSCGIGAEVCNFIYKNMILVNENPLLPMQVPEKPETNGNYADIMRVPSSATLTYEDGKLISNTAESAATVLFQYLPFKADETYVFGFNLTTEKADAFWKGARIIFGTDKEGNQLRLYIMESSIGVFVGETQIANVDLPRELGTDYRFDLLIEPDAISVWVNDILMLEKFKTPEKSDAKTGVCFEYAQAVMSNFDLYYTDLVEYVIPDIPEIPVLKNISSSQYNAADWMQVKLNGQTYTSYFGNKLSATDSSIGTTYLFENMPITDDMSYYYSATYTVYESTEIWKGPRFIFRYSDKTPMYVAITQDRVLILVGGKEIAAAPLKMEIGKSYDIVMYSTPNAISVWIDGQIILESVDLKDYVKLNAKLGVLFELCRAEITNIAIYGDEIVFNKDYVDMDLYNDKFYKMMGVPEMSEGGKNLFQNITMIDNSAGNLGAEFDKENNILVTEYTNGNGDLKFVDANGSSNLNGLRNESSYVFSFKYKVDDSEAEKDEDTGVWMILNKSSVPATTQPNEILVGIIDDALVLKVLKEGSTITEQRAEFIRQNGKEYDIAIVHGRNWIKVYIDEELLLIATQLPTYNVEFTMNIINAKSHFTDFMLYELEDSGLTILETAEGTYKTTAGNTIYDAEEYFGLTNFELSRAIVVLSLAVVGGSASGVVVLIHSNKKRRKEEEQINA